MPQKNAIDQRALKALVDFDIYANGDFKPESLGGLSEEDFEHARSAGLLFKPNVVEHRHDNAVNALRRLVSATKPRTLTDFFLASLSSGRLDYRAGLPAYAAGRNLPKHDLQVQPDSPYCQVCGMKKEYSRFKGPIWSICEEA